ncbi:hypothetical protein TSUD_148900 [Trifolium subterraneum]|uniref:Reverse transcriptase domain-containing protein n=1 Tax=Trifolium subterraneum TaxID=3900 RepID=A0A2Z6MZG5_TRISU|nr:hypothetical protein TSUD_148900 [Trifolium subterraneum]
MIVSSFNVRGLGGVMKRRRIRELVRHQKIDFLALQETKMEVLSEAFCYSLWGSDDCEWVFLPSVGRSGGILSIWGKTNNSLIFSFVGDGFVGICLEWGVLKTVCIVVNVYSKCDVGSKRLLWNNLLNVRRGIGGGRWCVVGDFNAVCRRDERMGVNSGDGGGSSLTEIGEFCKFIEELELVDLPLVGRRFTWYHANGRAMSRIDRILISDEWALRWGNCDLWVLPRDVSDHCPLILKYNQDGWGPKPFRFNNFWLQNKKLKEVVESCWSNLRVEGWMGFVLKEKLKGLKSTLKEWHKKEYESLEARVEELMGEISELDKRGEEVGLSQHEVEIRKEKFGGLWKLLKSKEALLFQRSRSKWLKEGDANTNFFHQSVRSRLKSNRISALRVDEVWLDSPNLIIGAVNSYFQNHVSSNYVVRPKLEGVVFSMLSEEENVSLTENFSLEEIKEVVWCSDGNKSPGPDGFNFAFLKNFWELLRGDIRSMFDQFHGNSCLPKSLLSYFVALIPKVSSPCSLPDFRPISLLGCLYKLIAKVLAKRLAKVMDSVIASNQSAFIKGRNLVDSVLVVNEVVDSAKKSKKECLIFKVDFEKAYDSVDWGFLEYMLRRCGFSEKWIGWMRACVFAGNLSVLVNGSPTSEINIQRGLKQGDPLAPFLFLLVVEGFGGVMRRAVDVNLFHVFSIGREPVVISHLQYADDTLCIGEASVENLWALKAILRGFELASGLKVNFWKSGLIGVNVDPNFLIMASTFLNCRLDTLPFNYLGLPVGANAKSIATWEPLLEFLRNRLNSWRNKHISLGGRIVMINVVLNAIPIFFLSFLRMPVKVLKQVVRIQREFLWGGVRRGKKVCWVKWSVVCKAKKKGGLGVRDVGIVNLSLLAKWWWRLLQPGRSLWKEVLVAIYGEHILHRVDWGESRIPSSASRWWKDICALDKVVESKNWLVESMARKIGNGNATYFWTSWWIGDAPLAVVFPRLYSLSNQKDYMVGDVWENLGDSRGWTFSWRRDLFQWECDLAVHLREILEAVVLSEEDDSWTWKPDQDGVFTVNSAYKFLCEELRYEEDMEEVKEWVFEHIWDSPAPSKVIAFSCQLLYDRVPTRSNLEVRGLLGADLPWECVGCVGSRESSVHLFLHCPSAMLVWKEVFRWLGVMIVIPPSLFSLFEIFRGSAKNAKIGQGFVMIWHATLWCLWKARNSSIFANGSFIPLAIVDEIKVISWKWCLVRLKVPACLFYEWNWDPGECLNR